MPEDSSDEENLSEMARTGTISKKKAVSYKAAPIPVVEGEPVDDKKVGEIDGQDLKIEMID